MSANAIWTSKNDEILIDFVKKTEALYNFKCKDYRNAQLKQNLWNSIGTVLEKSGPDCCRRWAYIRDYYVRRRGKPGISGGEAAKKRSELLSFLDGMPSSQKNTVSNIGDGDYSEIMEDLAGENTENDEPEIADDMYNNAKMDGTKHDLMKENNKKRKLPNSEERLQLLKELVHRKVFPAEKELDETDLFFNSMSKIVKKLPRYEQIHLRMQISSLVGNAELRTLSNESTTSRQARPSSSCHFLADTVLSPATVGNETSNEEEQTYILDATTSGELR